MAPEIGLDKCTIMLVPALLMSTIQELGTSPAREKASTDALLAPPVAVPTRKNGDQKSLA
ncbi:MAG: hypothetical protein ACYDGR_06845 [Candidatus Dormibacteria bacterium]